MEQEKKKKIWSSRWKKESKKMTRRNQLVLGVGGCVIVQAKLGGRGGYERRRLWRRSSGGRNR